MCIKAYMYVVHMCAPLCALDSHIYIHHIMTRTLILPSEYVIYLHENSDKWMSRWKIQTKKRSGGEREHAKVVGPCKAIIGGSFQGGMGGDSENILVAKLLC